MTAQRDDHGRFHIDEAAAEERRAQVVKLHVDGYSFREIGKQIGINEGTAYRDYAAVVERTRAEANASVDEERRVSLQRINRAIVVLMPMVDMGDLDAMDRLDKLEKRRAALLGLDAPTKVSAEVSTVDLDELDALRKAAEANACSSSDPGKPSDASGPSS